MSTLSPHAVHSDLVSGDLLSPGMVFRFDRDNTPNARILLSSIRQSGYTLDTALGDLIDNSLDASAGVVAIELERERTGWVVSIADDGCGMDAKVLDEMLRLGSNIEHDLATDLGKFGLGSTTASLSLGRRQHVITTAGSFLSGATDLDTTIETGSFVKHLDAATPAEIELFEQAFRRWKLPVPVTGTLVRITKCDNISRVVLKPAVDAAKKYIGRTYRYFISAGKSFYVNGELVGPIDPLDRHHPEAQILLEDTLVYEFPKSHARSGEIEKVGCILVHLPDWGGIEESKRHGYTADNSGFYLLRNRREIVHATTLDMYTRHPEFNRFRAELLFPATMDEDLGVSFLKSAWDIKPSQSLKDKLVQELMPYVRQSRKLYKKTEKVMDDAIPHEEAAYVIKQRSPFLRKPKSEIEKRQSSSPTPTALVPKPTDTGQSRSPREKVQSAIADMVEFRARSQGPTAPFYEASLAGRKVVVTYNVDHPFYDRFLFENRDNRSLMTGVDYLVYSLATAELLALSEDTYRFIERMREDVSFNLRQLLTT